VPCTRPIRGVRDLDGTVRLRKGIPDARLFGTGTKPELELPCGRCMDCKIRRTRDWVTRLTHESQLHDDNCYLTLTFSEDGLALRELQRGTHPLDLDIKDWQSFAKRLRKQTGPFRFFQVGEYGDENLRPHYHAVIFGQAWREGAERWTDEKGHPKWTHPIIEKCWPYGFHEIGEATPETLEYVAKYVQKKLFGKRLQAALERTDLQTGECVTVRPETASMSRGGRTGKGLGHGWWTQYKSDVFPDDFVVLNGKTVPTPRYYAKQLAEEDENAWNEISAKRKEKAETRKEDNTPERREVRAKVTDSKIKLQKGREL